MRKHDSIESVALIGPGRIGQAMGRLLAESGVPIAFIAARKLAAAQRAARFVGKGVPIALSDSRLLSASMCLITASDSAIAEIAAELALKGKRKDYWRGKVVLHTCGSVSSAVLDPLKLRGAAIGSIHPYQTVPSPQAGVRNLRDCFWAFEGDPRAVRVAKRWVKQFGGVAFPIRPEKKTLYHLSAFIVCPTVVTLMAQSSSLLQMAGIPERISRPMLRRFVTETARNFEDLGGRRALTGPAVRGDWETIRRHLTALRQAAPDFEPVYQSLLKAMLRLAGDGRATPVIRNGKSKEKRQKSKGNTR